MLKVEKLTVLNNFDVADPEVAVGRARVKVGESFTLAGNYHMVRANTGIMAEVGASGFARGTTDLEPENVKVELIARVKRAIAVTTDQASVDLELKGVESVKVVKAESTAKATVGEITAGEADNTDTVALTGVTAGLLVLEVEVKVAEGHAEDKNLTSGHTLEAGYGETHVDMLCRVTDGCDNKPNKTSFSFRQSLYTPF